MKNFGLRLAEIEVPGTEHGIGAEMVEESAPPAATDRHRIGVARWRVFGLMKLADANADRLAITQNPVAIGIMADEACGFEWIADPHRCKVLEDIVGTAAVRGRLALDEGEHVLLGVAVDELDVIDDEISAGEDSCAIHEEVRWWIHSWKPEESAG